MLIRELAADRWELVDGETSLGEFATYDLAVAFLGDLLAYIVLTAAAGDESTTLLPESWMSDQGICFSEATGDGRDFTQCAWSWRDPNASLLPLMLQTATEIGHFGAELAGYMQEVHIVGATPQASGRFYNTDVGRQARDLLADGRRFGVSVDCTSRPDVVESCTEEDADGFCMSWLAQFLSYQIGGLTMTPFPAFANASIVQSPTTVVASGTPAETHSFASTVGEHAYRLSLPGRSGSLSASGVALLDRPTITAPLRDWFETAEPAFGEPFALGSMGDEWLVDQGQGHVAMPLTITLDRRVLGHIAYWGQCHSGYANQCVSPPESACAYAHFHIGETICADGTSIPTGSFSASCDHAAAQLRARAAQDHYAHNGIAWANVRISNGVYGPWASGALRADVTDDQIAVLRAGAMSGDWRRLGGNLELVAALAVTTPGFPIAREAILASGLDVPETSHVATYTSGGELQTIVASGIVRRCPDCARRGAEAATQRVTRPGGQDSLLTGMAGSLARMEAMLDRVERRTRPMVDSAAAHLAAQIREIQG